MKWEIERMEIIYTFYFAFFLKWLKNYWHFVTGPTKSFQLTSSRGGWRICSCSNSDGYNFNSHPHEEDDESERFQLSWQVISTHILTRRMTATLKYSKRMKRFQLTSSQGGWPYWCDTFSFRYYFNSHPHKEDDYIEEVQ